MLVELLEVFLLLGNLLVQDFDIFLFAVFSLNYAVQKIFVLLKQFLLISEHFGLLQI